MKKWLSWRRRSKRCKDKAENVEKEVVKVFKNKEEWVRDAADKKKSIIVHGLKEKNIRYKPRRDREQLKSVRDLLKSLNDEEVAKLEEEVEATAPS